jgi:hypothetical protein
MQLILSYAVNSIFVVFVLQKKYLPKPVEIVGTGIAGPILPLRNGNPVTPEHWNLQTN